MVDQEDAAVVGDRMIPRAARASSTTWWSGMTWPSGGRTRQGAGLIQGLRYFDRIGHWAADAAARRRDPRLRRHRSRRYIPASE